jgi:hypothetical protein
VVSKGKIASHVFLGGVLGFGAYLMGRFVYELNAVFGSGRYHLPPPIDLTFAAKVVGALTTKLEVKPAAPGNRGKEDRCRTFFIWARARELGIADATLRDGPGLETLKQRVERQFTLVDAFVNKLVGTAETRGAYFGGPGGPEGQARHLDLGRYVSPRLIDPPSTTETDAIQAKPPSETQARALRELDRRRTRVIELVWRAAALDNDVWEGTGDDVTLRAAELTELLDRRLRSVERLKYEASSGATTSGTGSSFIERRWSSGNKLSSIFGPWRDDHTVRMFEAPSVPRAAKSVGDQWAVRNVIGDSGNVVKSASFPRFTADLISGTFFSWFQNHMTDEFDWNEWPGTRMGRDAVAATKAWVRLPGPGVGRDGSAWVLQPEPGGMQAAEIVRHLFLSSQDWWERAWLHSDGVLAAIHLEALRHAKLRRDGKDDLFNALPASFSLALDDYFEVRVQRVKTPNGIMRPGRNEYFENAAVAFDDLQVGDQVLFETNPVMSVLGVTAWEYPTVLISGLDTSDTASDQPRLLLHRLQVQGFGAADLDYPSFQLLLARNLDRTLQAVRDEIQAQLQLRATAGFPPTDKLEWDSGAILEPADSANNDQGLLRRWNPYGDAWDLPGPWWIWINLKAPMWRGAFGDDPVKILGQTPGGIVWIADDKLLPEFRGRADPASTLPLGAGFQEPPWKDDPFGPSVGDPRKTIFVPLFEPDGGWIGYFEDKARDPTVHYGPRLNPVVADAKWLPGLARSQDKIRVIRPRLKPPT